MTTHNLETLERALRECNVGILDIAGAARRIWDGFGPGALEVIKACEAELWAARLVGDPEASELVDTPREDARLEDEMAAKARELFSGSDLIDVLDDLCLEEAEAEERARMAADDTSDDDEEDEVEATCYDVVDGAERTRTVRVDRASAIRAAAEYLDAEEADGEWRYTAAEDGAAVYRLSEQDMIDAGASIEHSQGEWYSLWCASCGEAAPETVTVTASEMDALTWHVPPVCAGQIVETAYAVAPGTDRVYRRCTDSSDGSVDIAVAEIPGDVEPWQAEPQASTWTPVVVEGR